MAAQLRSRSLRQLCRRGGGDGSNHHKIHIRLRRGRQTLCLPHSRHGNQRLVSLSGHFRVTSQHSGAVTSCRLVQLPHQLLQFCLLKGFRQNKIDGDSHRLRACRKQLNAGLTDCRFRRILRKPGGASARGYRKPARLVFSLPGKNIRFLIRRPLVIPACFKGSVSAAIFRIADNILPPSLQNAEYRSRQHCLRQFSFSHWSPPSLSEPPSCPAEFSVEVP